MRCRVHVEFEGLFEGAAERFAPESRDAEDQVDGDVSESGPSGVPDGLGSLGGVVAAVHQPQAVVIERLDADRQAVDADPPQGVEVVGREVVGVGFEGGLRHVRAVEDPCGMVQQPAQYFGGTERRGSASEITGLDGFSAEVVAAGLQFAEHGFGEGLQTGGSDLLEEVAIGADALAEGDMEVKSGHNISKLIKIIGSGTGFRFENGSSVSKRSVDRVFRPSGAFFGPIGGRFSVRGGRKYGFFCVTARFSQEAGGV